MSVVEKVEKPTKVRTSGYILKHIQRYPDLRFDGVTVSCPSCNVRLVSSNLFNWRKHLQSQKHQRNKQLNFSYAMFLCDCVLLFSICNIPMNVLDKKPFRHFWKKFAPDWPLPSRTSAWRKMCDIKRLIQDRIREELHDNQIWLTVDETPDTKGTNVIHVFARVLQPEGPSSPYLLASKRLQAVTPEAIQQLVVEALTIMDINSSHVLMLVTDSARYMLKAGRLLKSVYYNLVHITCTVHTLQMVIEEIRKNYPEVDRLMSSTKDIFVTSEKDAQNFRLAYPDIPLPPQSDLTRGTTWLEAVSYYHQHYHKIKSFVIELDPGETQTIIEVQEQFRNQQVEADMQTINDNYSIVGDSIKKLENPSLSLADSLNILDTVEAALRNLKDPISEQVTKKFNEQLKTNPDYKKLQFINQCLIDKYPVDSLQPFFTFANITTVNIERSFSHYADVFLTRRRCFVETNMEALLLIRMYSQMLPTPVLSMLSTMEEM